MEGGALNAFTADIDFDVADFAANLVTRLMVQTGMLVA